MAISECPVDNCDICDYHRSVSWCSRAIPHHKEIDEAYKIRIEGFFEGCRACEQEYQACIDTLEELNQEFLDHKYEEVVHCEDCEFYRGHEEYCVNDIFAREGGYCHYGMLK